MTKKPWLIYGVTGFTGQLCAKVAAERGEKPIVAGRSEATVKRIADEYHFPYRVFPLDDPDRLRQGLAGVGAILLTAGPFGQTSAPVLDACLELGVHYLDITGEIAIFEACRSKDAMAKAAGIVILPGTGFDVVPSDCLARSLAQALPGATALELAFAGGNMSKGTAKTAVARLHESGFVRRDGELQPMATGALTRDVPFRDKTRPCMNIPWGDIATAYQSTGIPNITVYARASRRVARSARVLGALGPLLATRPVKWALDKAIDKFVTGPDENAQKNRVVQLWGRVERPDGQAIEGTLVTPEAYALTAQTSVDATLRVLAGKAPAGSLTPALAFGPSYITEFAGCDLRVGSAAAKAAV